MRANHNQKLEAVELCRERPALMVKEILGLEETPRTIQRWYGRVYGPRPTRRDLERHDVLRTRVVALMIAGGLNERYCVEGHWSFHPCLIRELKRDSEIGSLAFVCTKRARPGTADFKPFRFTYLARLPEHRYSWPGDVQNDDRPDQCRELACCGKCK
jgi:hypothetical protein